MSTTSSSNDELESWYNSWGERSAQVEREHQGEATPPALEVVEQQAAASAPPSTDAPTKTNGPAEAKPKARPLPRAQEEIVLPNQCGAKTPAHRACKAGAACHCKLPPGHVTPHRSECGQTWANRAAGR